MSLNAARARLSRAETHLNDLREEERRFQEANAHTVGFEPNPHVPEELRKKMVADARGRDVFVPFSFVVPDIEVPSLVSILVGEIADSLRSALDYLVFELSLMDSGQEQDGTQFPIFESKSLFRRNEAKYLNGVNTAHRAAIERLQPYRGGTWLRLIPKLSNRHKHRTLLTVRNAARTGGTMSVGPAVGLPGATQVDMQLHLTPSIVFEDVQSVVATLEGLQKLVTETIDAFDPEFH